MSTFFLIISIWLLEATFGIKVSGDDVVEFDKPKLLAKRGAVVVPYISAFVLAVVPLAILLPVHWVLILILNPFFLFVAGPLLTNAYMVRFAWGRGPSWDMFYCFLGGIITLVIGLLIRYHSMIGELIDRIM